MEVDRVDRAEAGAGKASNESLEEFNGVLQGKEWGGLIFGSFIPGEGLQGTNKDLLAR